MSATVASYAYVGFVVQESDFWDVVPAKVATCEKGHECEGPFCPQDGTKVEKRHGRVASAKFQALAKHFGWRSDDTGLRSWLDGFERIYANLTEDLDDTVRLCTVNRFTPTHDGPEVLAIAKPVSTITKWTKAPLIDGLSMQELVEEFGELVKARDAAGFDGPVRLFFSLYAS